MSSLLQNHALGANQRENRCVPCSTFAHCVKIKEIPLCPLFYICALCENQRDVSVSLVLHLCVV